MEFKQPLSIYFIWHNSDKENIFDAIEYCFNSLKRDIDRPFSRTLNLPVFFRTSINKNVPSSIESDSKKTIIFAFISKYIVSDLDWKEYIKSLQTNKKNQIIPIALDNSAFNLNDNIKNTNCIRSYSFDDKYFKENLLISISHEIYRLALNENYQEIALGTDTAIELFLSHAKDGKQGLNIAKALKDFIDKSSMRNFFDTTDIAPGYLFNKEIENHIKISTMISINSDPYSSRYWCQKEIQYAKENNRPIIAVDCLEEYEDRRFPIAANIPGVHVHTDDKGKVNDKDIYRILTLSLIETIRYFYSKILLNEYKNCGWFDPESIILSRPPDITDLQKVNDGENETKLVYPEPPVYSDELIFFRRINIKAVTPLQSNLSISSDRSIGISISDPSIYEMVEMGQTQSHLKLLSQDIARHLLAREYTVIYGGDLRSNGFTEYLLLEAQAVQARLVSTKIFLKNFLAWPIYNKDRESLTDWISKYNLISEMIKVEPPEDIAGMISSKDDFLIPTTPVNLYLWSKSLTKMRNVMIDQCDARICAGGRHTDYKGKMPGVLEEILITIEKKKPLYLLGGFGGVAKSVCDSIENKSINEKITGKWQSENNAGYQSFLDYIDLEDKNYMPNYDSLVELLKFENLRNGLSKEENIKLFRTINNDEAIYLVLKGLKNI
ncbi:MAG: TIR domain-containing protein [Candidatus Delongbacteria bacterium]|jgi:hypothetical protein